jgi:uncharacterized protein
VRPLFTIVIMLATMATAALSQTPSPESRTAAIRLVEALNWRAVMEPVRAEALTRVKTNLRTRLREELGSPTPEEQAEVEAMVDELLSKYTLDDTIADLVPLLQVHYSTAEMEELAAFFSTPVYKKFNAELPEIHRTMMETLNRKTQPLIRNTVERVSARIGEMKSARSYK